MGNQFQTAINRPDLVASSVTALLQNWNNSVPIEEIWTAEIDPVAASGPDFCKRLLPHVADEVVGEVAAEADLAVRLDLGEVPGDRAAVVAERLAEVGEILRDFLGRHVRDAGNPRAAEGGI